MSSLTDSELLARYLAEGSEEAFATLVARHLPLVYGAAFRHLNDSARAREVAQNVFITLARRGVWLTGHPSLGGWLYRTALHLARHESRAEQRRRQREQTALELGTCMKLDDSPLDAIAPVLDEAMLELRAADREALLLRFFANKSMREVGVALGIQEDAAQKRVAKALDALTERFRRRGFRVSGASAAAVVLQQAASAAIPEGLALVATKAAVTAGAAASLGSLTMPVIKFMSLTKIQTAALCVAVAVVPLGYQWHVLNHARDEGARLSSELGGLREAANAHEKDLSRAERRLAVLEDERMRRVTRQRAPAKPGPAPNLYVWDENSPYVRVPKSTLRQLQFAPFATRTARDGKTDRYQLPPLLADGTPQPALAAALGLSAAESQQLTALCQNTFAAYNDLAASHSQLTDAPVGNNLGVKLSTAAFPDEGGQLRDQFQQQLTGLLGSERAETFWEETMPMFNQVLNNFGAVGRDLQLIYNANQTLELFNSTPGSASVAQLEQRNGLPLPAQLQSYADTWGAEIAARAAQKLTHEMKKILIAAAVFGIAAGLWTREHSQLDALTRQNTQLAAEAGERNTRAQNADSAKQTADQRFNDLRRDLRSTLIVPANSTDTAVPTTPAPPDLAHQGGWPKDAVYFYLPKQYLTNVSYRLLKGDHVTDEAAALLGMTLAERESVNRSFEDLLGKFRLLEIDQMRQISPPEGWLSASSTPGMSGLNFSSAVIYKIPDLAGDMSAAQDGLSQQLQQVLGDSRAQLMQSATDSYLRQNVDDLGAGERTVGFVWSTESDGSQSLWYALAGAQYGEGGFQRVPADLDPNSQIAYYANLLGVKLPGQN